MSLAYPDTAAALFDLLDHEGSPAYPQLILQVDKYGVITPPFPTAHLFRLGGGTETYVDRTDIVQVDVYAADGLASDAAETVLEHVRGDQRETRYGFLDAVEPLALPADVPSLYENVQKATMTVRVTVRPVGTFES